MLGNIIKCPQCDQPLTQVGQFWICPQHGQVFLEKPFTPLRIFLSYGHDSNEELVRQIKTDLEKRGHDVWFDKSEIKTGHDWRDSITKGILESNRVLSFLSKYSTRNPGVCLDEIAIAIGVKGGNIQTILVESEQEVKPPPSIGYIQWLDMHDWKENHNAGEAVWKKWFQEKLREIVSVIESDESLLFAGDIEKLNGYLKPTDSDFNSNSRIRKLLEKELVGRTWMFNAVEQWRNTTDRGSRLFWITGAPGVGKSAFAAHLAHYYGRGTVIAVQFCDWQKTDHRNANQIIRTLAFQIATRLPDYRKLLLHQVENIDINPKNANELFEYLLLKPLHLAIGGGRERYLIVIDALDEAGGDGHNELVNVLADNAKLLPDWIGIIVTSRPEFDVTTRLQAFNPFPFETKSDDNSNDIRAYLWRELAKNLQNRIDTNKLIEQILEKSEGVFLYIEHFCDEVQHGHLSLNSPELFPRGLGGIYFQYFQRQFPNEEEYEKTIEPALGAILAAREPLPVEILQKLFGWRDNDLRKWLHKFGSLFPNTTDTRIEVIKPFHKSLADWLMDQKKAGIYFVSVDQGHSILTNLGWSQYKQDPKNYQPYYFINLPSHLASLRRWADLFVLIQDAQWNLLQRWTQNGVWYQGIECLSGLLESHSEVFANQLNRAGVATQLARIYISLGRIFEATEWLQHSILLSNGPFGRRIRSIAYHELGSVLLYQGKRKEARESYEKALTTCLLPPIIQDEAAANFVALATIAQLDYIPAAASSYALKALEFANSSGDIPHKIASLRILGIAHRDVLEMSESIQLVKNALDLAIKSDIKHEIIACQNALAWITYHTAILTNQSISEAREIFRTNIEVARKVGNIPYKIEGVIGMLICAFNDYDINIAETLLASIPFPSNTSDSLIPTNLIAYYHIFIASLAHLKGERERAVLLYQNAIGFCNEHLERSREADAWAGLGASYFHSNDQANAERCWHSAIELANSCSQIRAKLVSITIDNCRLSASVTPF